MSKQYERDKTTIGNYQVFLRGRAPDIDVIMTVTSSGAERILTPPEALQLLEWLADHETELEQAANWQQTDTPSI